MIEENLTAEPVESIGNTSISKSMFSYIPNYPAAGERVLANAASFSGLNDETLYDPNCYAKYVSFRPFGKGRLNSAP